MSLLPPQSSLRSLTRDGRLLFLTRSIRLFAYGFVSVILVLYLTALGLGEAKIGLLLTLTLIGDTGISLALTTHADRLGRRRTLLAGAALMLLAGLVFALTRDFALLVAAGIIGVISPSGLEVGPFLSIEQAALSHIIADRLRTALFAWYALFGSLATALGALVAGGLTHFLQRSGMDPVVTYRMVLIGYAIAGAALALLFTRLSSAVEVAPTETKTDSTQPMILLLGLGRSRGIVLRLSGLFALDAFAGGFVIQSFLAFWFVVRFGASPALLGGIFFSSNLLAGISALLASRIAARFGLVNTMVFTHLPSNVLLMLVPLMPTLPLAILLLLLRFSISQMDVPTRQSYTMAVVKPAERSAAAGITGVARTTGAAIAPLLAGPLFAQVTLLALPFVISGGLKIVYDVLLYRSFTKVRPPEEVGSGQ